MAKTAHFADYQAKLPAFGHGREPIRIISVTEISHVETFR